MEEIFDEKQEFENNNNKAKLYNLISSGDAILMVGAGSSASIYPTWSKFIDDLEFEAKSENDSFDENKADYLLFVDKVKNVLGSKRYYAFLHETFKPKETLYLPFHKVLCSLPFKGITTTNYDSILESALLSITPQSDNYLCLDGFGTVKIYEFLLSLHQNSTYPKRIVHLHGRYDIESSIILSESEYIEKYGFSVKVPPDKLFDHIKKGIVDEKDFEKLLLRYGYIWSLRRKILWALLATRRVVFVGFSMTDPYFQKMFEFVSDDLSSYRFDTHFLILRITNDTKESAFQFAKKLKRNYGIETVFFKDDSTFKGLEDFIYEMGNTILPKEVLSVHTTESPFNKNKANKENNRDLLQKIQKQIFDENK